VGTAEDFTGRKFGRLTAVRIGGHNDFGVRLWLWRCDCGIEIERPSGPIKQGRQVSCGCHKNEQSRLRAKHGKWETRTYRAWIEMKARARGKDDSSKKNYLDRGIGVDPRWQRDFAAFLSDMGECPDGLTLERIKNDVGYQPGNCKWATQGEQTRNTRRTVRVRVEDREMCLKDACAMAGVNYDRIRSRIRLGKSPQIAFDMG
jgi:hypothetical protein